MKILSGLGLFSLLLSIFYVFGMNPLQFQVFPLFALLYGIITILIPLIIWWRTSKAFEQNWIFKEPVLFEVSDKGLLLKGEESKRHLEWDDIVSALKLSDAWVIYLSSVSYFYIPFLQLNQQNANELEQLIRKHCVSVKGL